MPRAKYEVSEEIMIQIRRNIQNNRLGRGLSQQELARLISTENRSKEVLTNLAISTYERGDRCPPLPTLIALANIFDLTLDELVGNPTRKKRNIDNAKRISEEDSKDFIRPEDYLLYDKKPVWIEERGRSGEGCWGILDYRGHDDNVYVYNSQGVMKVDSSISLFTSAAVDAIQVEDSTMRRVNISELPSHETVYCVSTSHDPYIKTLYTGYYKADKSRMILVNRTNGLALPYTGLGISFQAFA